MCAMLADRCREIPAAAPGFAVVLRMKTGTAAGSPASLRPLRRGERRALLPLLPPLWQVASRELTRRRPPSWSFWSLRPASARLFPHQDLPGAGFLEGPLILKISPTQDEILTRGWAK